MGTNYVGFRNHGFWARDSILSSWLTTLLDEMRVTLPDQEWHQPLIRHWELQTLIDGGCIALDLDSFLADNEQRHCVINAAESALARTPDADERTGQLFVALLRGELKTDASSPIDYL